MEHHTSKLLKTRSLGQYINVAGIKGFINALLFHREYFRPHLQVKNINYVNFQKLHQCGIRYIVFDKDNTLTLPYHKEIHEDIKPGL